MAELSKGRRFLLIGLIVTAFLPLSMDLTILHVASPTLSKDFHASGVEILWILDIYAIFTGALLIPMGTLADRIGPRRLYLLGLWMFFLLSIVAAYAPNVEVLIAARALMGAAASMIVPGTLALVRALCKNPREIATAYGFWSAAGSGGCAAGPLIAGFLLEHYFVGSVFLINVFILGAVIPFLMKGLPENHAGEKKPWPILQGVLMGTGMLMVIFSFKLLGKGILSGYILAVVGFIGIALLIYFWKLQKRSENPMLDLGLFKITPILWGSIVSLAVVSSLSGVEYTIAQELQFVYRLTPLEAGLFMLPLMVASLVASPLTGKIIGKFTIGGILGLALFLSALGLFALGSVEMLHHRWFSGFALVLIGTSLALGLTTSSTAVMNFAPEGKAASAGSLEGIGYDMGSGLGIAIFGTILTNVYALFIELPQSLTKEQALVASHSISDTFAVASQLPKEVGEAVIQAGQAAYLPAHSAVLFTVGSIFVVLAILVYIKMGKLKAI